LFVRHGAVLSISADESSLDSSCEKCFNLLKLIVFQPLGKLKSGSVVAVRLVAQGAGSDFPYTPRLGVIRSKALKRRWAARNWLLCAIVKFYAMGDGVN
jgi:hypothetical protein